MTWFSIYVAMHALLVTLLALNVSRLRVSLRIANGDGEEPRMRRAMRAHGNAVEHVLLYGMLVLALALEGAGNALMALLVIGFAVSRILHAVGMLRPDFRFRRVGAGAAYLFELVAILALVRQLL